ncbi:MAG: hypothetical protein KBT13_08890 [Bacteroidales bacterium]|nr:hypothetical protein [Candidatus Sodaliphilus limicaballi]
MNKLKTLLLLTLGAAALTAQAQEIDGAQHVIDQLTANGGYCQTIYYSASYQNDTGDDATLPTGHSNNMYIKDSFGKARFVDGNRTVTVNGEECKTVILQNAFGGLFDWTFYINSYFYTGYWAVQPYDECFPVKGENGKYVRLHMMSSVSPDDGYFTFDDNLAARTQEYEFLNSSAICLWTSEGDGDWIKNTCGTVAWPRDHFDYSLYLSPFGGCRWYFLRLAVKNGDYQNPRVTDTEEYHYDFYFAEFRHYNPNTTVTDILLTSAEEDADVKANPDKYKREFHAMAELDGEDFYVYNFSDFGPNFTQKLVDGRGYGHGERATISPMTGKLLPNGIISIPRQAGYVHYERAYESQNYQTLGKTVNTEYFDYEDGKTYPVLGRTDLDPSLWAFTTWHDCKSAGVKTDAAGNYNRESLELQDEITGSWENGTPVHHHADNNSAAATNPWVTDGGTCRTQQDILLNINPYVYCTDEQMSNGEFDHKDDNRGGIYKLTHLDIKQDITLDLAINNSNGEIVKNMQKVIKTDGQNNVISEHVAVPVEFTVNDNDQYVDHYELCIHECNGIHDVTVASDEAFANADSPLNEAMNDLVYTYTLEKDNYSSALRDTDGPKLYKAYVESGEYDKETGAPIYTKVPNFDLPKGRDYVTMTIFVKAVYTEESGLAPTYHSLQNVHVKHDTIVTGIDDINVESVKTSKVLENGQVFIIKNGVKYNTMGQRVK